MSLLGNFTSYDNFEGFVPKNTVNRFKMISPKQARSLTYEHPGHMYGTKAYQGVIEFWAVPAISLILTDISSSGA